MTFAEKKLARRQKRQIKRLAEDMCMFFVEWRIGVTRSEMTFPGINGDEFVVTRVAAPEIKYSLAISTAWGPQYEVIITPSSIEGVGQQNPCPWLQYEGCLRLILNMMKDQAQVREIAGVFDAGMGRTYNSFPDFLQREADARAAEV